MRVESLALLLAAVALRACVGLHGYSGEGCPPMFGDFEAQRHWMELTVNLPASEWYVHSAHNNLSYWGIDYPPLSAHVSCLFGLFARRLHPELVSLHTSRGYESSPTRSFMRNTVLLSDALVFFPAAYATSVAVSHQRRAQLHLLLLLLFLPSFVLVDHGHFQYNCIASGLALWGAYGCLTGRPLCGSIAFSLALNFKQMSLYLAPAFFCYLLAGCLAQSGAVAKLRSLCMLGLVVVATFAICWLPWLRDTPSAFAVLTRVFPLERHLYEDKVCWEAGGGIQLVPKMMVPMLLLWQCW